MTFGMTFTPIASLADLTGELSRHEVAGQTVALARVGEHLYAFGDECTHLTAHWPKASSTATLLSVPATPPSSTSEAAPSCKARPSSRRRPIPFVSSTASSRSPSVAEPIVIVGGGVAGATAAVTLRERGLGRENVAPYERPLLSKEYLRGEADPPPFRPPEFWFEQETDLRTGEAVEALDLIDRRVRLHGGGELGYDKLLLATGARARRLGVPGDNLYGVV